MSAPEYAVRSAAETRRDVAAAYRRRYGRERPPVRWDDQACAAWRRAHRDAGMSGAWTYTPVPSAAALLTTLDALGGTCNGAALARAAGVPQGHATSVSLPRFARMGLVTDSRDDVEGAAGRTGSPTRWTITAPGRALARELHRGEIR